MNEEAFEIRLQFTELLGGFSTSKKSLSLASNFALKHYQYHEDLFDCLFGELTDERNSSLFVKNLLVLLENITHASTGNTLSGYRNCWHQSLKPMIESLLSPKRPFDEPMAYMIKLLEVTLRRDWFSDSAVEFVERSIRKYRSTAKPVHSSGPLSTAECLERIEEEREIEKRLREQSWQVRPADRPLELQAIFDSLSDWSSENEQELAEEYEKFIHKTLQ